MFLSSVIFIVFLRVFASCVVILFLSWRLIFSFDFAHRLFLFSLLEPHSELQRTWLYRKFRKSNLYFFYVKVMKRSHFFLSKISFSGFCPYFHGRAHQGNFFFPIFGVPLLTNRINQKLPWTGPKKCNTK